MAGGDPGAAGIERIEERGLALAGCLGQADIERRPHDETLQLRLHHAIRAAGTRQSKVVTTHRRADDIPPRVAGQLTGMPCRAAGARYTSRLRDGADVNLLASRARQTADPLARSGEVRR